VSDLKLDRHIRIRLPRSEMALGFKGGHPGAQVRFRRAHLVVPYSKRGGGNTAFPDEGREQHEHVLATARAAARAGCEEPTLFDHRDRPERRGDEFDNDHKRDYDEDDNRDASHYGRRMIYLR
jgi:hypothetical protein